MSHSPQEQKNLEAMFRETERNFSRLGYRNTIHQVAADIIGNVPPVAEVHPALLTRCIGPMVLTQLKLV